MFVMWYGRENQWLTESESLINAQHIVNHYANSDWSKNALSGVLGNMRHESSINPNMSEFGYSWEADRGFGLVQWTPRSKYWDWAEANGLLPRLGTSQLARIDFEIANNIQYIPTTAHPETFSQFRSSTKSVEYLTNAFCWNYERPNRQAGEESMPSRVAFALRCFNELEWNGYSDGDPGGADPPPTRQTNDNKIYALWLSGALKW